MSITEQTTNKDMIQRSFTVPIPIDRAFIIFTEELGTWWPQEYTWQVMYWKRLVWKHEKEVAVLKKAPMDLHVIGGGY
jgi:hypothetical protein